MTTPIKTTTVPIAALAALTAKKYYRLKVSLRLQGPRLPSDVTFHLGGSVLGFPGFKIEAGLMRLLVALDGSTVLMKDPAVDSGAAETALLDHFLALTGASGPPNARWHLLSATNSWTIENKIRWSGGYQAFAAQLGKQERTPVGDFDPSIAPVEFLDTYEFPDPAGGPARTLNVRLWICFELGTP